VVKIKNEVSKELTSVDIAKVLDKVMESLSQSIKESKAEIDVNFNGTHVIYAPRTYVESIFLNMTSNALKYRREDVAPKISIHAAVENDNFCIRVKDNGLGIDLDKHGTKLFGLRKTFHRNKDSRGVGLFITRAQVESLGGEINVKSKPMEGAEFIISFPLSILNKQI
jgi:light-regulated signal transduction histidine kinase (bacteriophytochrome)